MSFPGTRLPLNPWRHRSNSEPCSIDNDPVPGTNGPRVRSAPTRELTSSQAVISDRAFRNAGCRPRTQSPDGASTVHGDEAVSPATH